MSEIRISRSSRDLAQLEAEGFRLRLIQGSAYHLLVEGIPAVTSKREAVPGTLYCPLEIDKHGKTVNPCSNHQSWWIGEPTDDANGLVLAAMIHQTGSECQAQ